MKLITREQYESMSPVKQQVYEKRVRKYYGIRQMKLATEPWILGPDRPSTVMLYDPIKGHRFVSTKEFLDAHQTAANILLGDEKITIHEAICRLREETGL